MTDRQRYQISLQATDLRNIRWCGRICPYAEVKVTSGRLLGTTLGETEHIVGTTDPDWVKIFFLEFSPGEVLNLQVTIYDYRVGQEPTFLAEADFEATSVYQSQGNIKEEIIGPRESSKVFCHIEKSLQGYDSGLLHLHLRGLDIKNVEPGAFGLGRSDPFFEISKKNADYVSGQVKWNVVYRSETIDNNLNPYWKDVKLSLEVLCHNKLDWPIKISVYDHNENGKHKLIGETHETTIEGLAEQISIKGNADREQAIRLTIEDKPKTYGLLCVLKVEVIPDD